MRSRRFKRSWVLSIVLWAFAAVMVLPLVLTLTASFMGENEILATYGPVGYADSFDIFGKLRTARLTFVPEMFSLQQYYTVLIESPGYLYMFWNSVRITMPIILGQVLVAAPAAFAFAKLRFPLKNALFFTYVLTMMMPFQVTLVPNYLMVDSMGLLGSFWAIILPGIFSTFGVFLLRQFMSYIPDDYLEAARIDGASTLRSFVTIILPLCRAGVTSLIILSFIDNWNLVEQPLLFLRDGAKQPLSLYLSKLREGAFGIAFASSMLYMLPVLLVFLYGENDLVEGIVLSGIKG